MERISQWCTAVSLVSVLSSVVILLLPESSTKKAFKVLLSVMLVYTVFSPLSDGFDKISLDEMFSFSRGTYELEEYENFTLLTAAESETEKYIITFAESINADISCEVACSYEEAAIRVKSVEISGEIDKEQEARIKEELNKLTDGKTNIIFTGDRYD